MSDSAARAGCGSVSGSICWSSVTFSLSMSSANCTCGASKFRIVALPVAFMEPSDAARFLHHHGILRELQIDVPDIERLLQRRRSECRILNLNSVAAKIHGRRVLDRTGRMQIEGKRSAAAHSFGCRNPIRLGDIEYLADICILGAHGGIHAGGLARVLSEVEPHGERCAAGSGREVIGANGVRRQRQVDAGHTHRLRNALAADIEITRAETAVQRRTAGLALGVNVGAEVFRPPACWD